MSAKSYEKTIRENFNSFIESKKPEIESAFNLIKKYEDLECIRMQDYGEIIFPNGVAKITKEIKLSNGQNSFIPSRYEKFDNFILSIKYNRTNYSIDMESFTIYVDGEFINPLDLESISNLFHAIDLINRYEITNIRNLKNLPKVKLIAELDGKTYELTKEEMRYIIGD